MSASGLETVIGRNLARLRAEAGYTQEDLAQMASISFGFRWTRATIGAIEIGRRALSWGEVLMLAQIFGEPIRELVPALLENRDGTTEVDDRWVISSDRLTEIVTGNAPSVKRPEPGITEAERTAAATLGKELRIKPIQVISWSRALWGRSLAAERYRRLLQNPGEGDANVRAGHITRALLNELRAHAKDQKRKAGRKK